MICKDDKPNTPQGTHSDLIQAKQEKSMYTGIKQLFGFYLKTLNCRTGHILDCTVLHTEIPSPGSQSLQANIDLSELPYMKQH